MTESDVYYSRPDVDYMKTVECLRVRSRDGFAEITYKPASDRRTTSNEGVISKHELNVLLNGMLQADVAQQLLTAIGMIKLATVVKHRQTFTHSSMPDVTISVDAVDNAGLFIEVEVLNSNIDTATNALSALESQLGIVDYPVVMSPYRDIVMGL